MINARKFVRKFVVVALLLIGIGILSLTPIVSGVCPVVAPIKVEAQDQMCPNVLLQALKFARNECTALGRNRACYGNVQASAEPQTGITQFHFTSPGDVVNVTDLKTIRLGAYNALTNAWGIVLMRVQASLPDSAPGQNVLILMFGDVNANNMSDLSIGQTPIQAFAFRTAIDPPICRRLPSSGIVLQSQAANGTVEMIANGVHLSFASTVFLQSQPGQSLNISTVEGRASVESQGYSMRVPAGSMVRVPMDQNSAPSGPPAPPETYNLDLQPALQIEALGDNNTVSAANPNPNCRNSG